MKWELKQKAQVGDYREVEKFAWLPTVCVGNLTNLGGHTEYLVWCEHYIDYQQYKKVMVEQHGHGYYEECWDTISKNIIPKDKK